MSGEGVVVMTVGEELEAEDGLATTNTPAADEHRITAPTTAAMAVVHGMATVLERDVEELAPIADAIDPDALNSLVRSWIGREVEAASVTFEYCGCSVTVDGSGDVFIPGGDLPGGAATTRRVTEDRG